MDAGCNVSLTKAIAPGARGVSTPYPHILRKSETPYSNLSCDQSDARVLTHIDVSNRLKLTGLFA